MYLGTILVYLDIVYSQKYVCKQKVYLFFKVELNLSSM